MSQNWQEHSQLPEPLLSALQVFVEEAVAATKNALESIVLYGSAVKHDFCEETSDLNLLLVFREISLQTLDAFAPVFRKGQTHLPLGVMLYSREDLARSTDVFPIKFMDIKAHHQLLWGSDVLTTLEVQEEHLRLRCEQELKNLAIRLRMFYLQESQRAEQIERKLERVFSSLLISLEALQYLKTGKHASTQAETIERCAAHLDTDTSVLTSLLKLKRRQVEMEFDELKSLYEELMKLVSMTAEIADKLEV